MKFVIETSRHQHLVKTEAELRSKHAKKISEMQSKGLAVRLHEDSDPVEAEVNHGQWLFTCDCGAGVAADPQFRASYCFGCGAIHTNVVFPPEEDRLNIEHVLLARKKTVNRLWEPGEKLRELLAQNAEHGVKL